MNTDTNTNYNKTNPTQKQVDDAIDHLLSCGWVYEKASDNNVFESPEFWDNHDKATNLYEAARALMPGQGASGIGWW